MNFVEVFLPASPKTFEAKAYLLANADVALAKVDPFRHFYDNGLKEGRRIINPELLQSGDYRKEKYDLFKRVINVEGKHNAFPISVGASHFSLDDYQSESANHEFQPFAAEIMANPDRLYMDLGCGLRERVHRNCLYVEVYPSVSADLIVEPKCTYPIRDQSLDGIGCFAVLEHTRKPWLVVGEMFRMLKPGGKVWIDWPFLQPVHGYPSHYFNATREGMSSIFGDAGFKVDSVATGDHEKVDHTVSWILGELVKSLPEKHRDRLLNLTVADLINQPPRGEFWSPLVNSLDDRAQSTLSCGNTLIATKSE